MSESEQITDPSLDEEAADGEVQVLVRVEGIAAAAVAELEEPSLYLSRDWLRTARDMLTADHPYLVYRSRRGRLLGLLPCQFLAAPGAYSPYDPAELLLGQPSLSAAEPWLKPLPAERLRQLGSQLGELRHKLLLPALLATAPSGYRSGALCHRRLSLASRRLVLVRLLSAFSALASERRAAVAAFLYLPRSEDALLEEVLTAAEFSPSALAGECYLNLQWDGFDAYLQSFDPHRRRTIRADIRKFTAAGCTIELAGAAALNDELAKLQVQTQRRYGHPLSVTEVLRTYRRVQALLSSRAVVLVCRRKRAALGFALFYRHLDRYYARAAGFDYGRLADEACYFNLVFYEPIRRAIAEGIERIEYGSESYQAKLMRGCRLRVLNGWFKFSGPAAPLLHELASLRQNALLYRLNDEERRFSRPSVRPSSATRSSDGWARGL